MTRAAIKRDPEFIPDISELWSGSTTRNKFVKAFLSRLARYRPLTEEEDAITEHIDRLYDFRNYPFSALQLSEPCQRSRSPRNSCA